MKILNKEEIKIMANYLTMTETEAQDVADIFVDIYTKEQSEERGWKIYYGLESVDDYIREWEDHWHREGSEQEFYEYEKEHCFYDYPDETIFDSLETFLDGVKNTYYKLAHSDMVIIVC